MDKNQATEPNGRRAKIVRLTSRPSPQDQSLESIGLIQADQRASLLAAIVDSSEAAIVSKDLNGIVTSWNRGAEKLFGYAPGEIIGNSISILIPRDLQDEEPEILDRIRRGERDVLIVTRLDRLARSTRDLLNILDTVAKAGAGFRSLADAWADTTTPHGRLMLTVLGGLAEFERELIQARTGEGRKRAQARGVKFGRPPKLSPHQRREAIQRLRNGETQAEIAQTYGVDATTIGRLDCAAA
jgi:hypothetical protein